MADFSAGLEPSREGERPDAQQQVFWPCGHENLPKTPNSITMRFLLRVFYPWDTRTSPKKGIFGRVLPPGKQHTSFDRSAGGGTGVPLGPKWQSFLLPASQKDFANGCHLASPQSGFGQFWRQSEVGGFGTNPDADDSPCFQPGESPCPYSPYSDPHVPSSGPQRCESRSLRSLTLW